MKRLAKMLVVFFVFGILTASVFSAGCVGKKETTTGGTQTATQTQGKNWPQTLRFLHGSPGGTWEQIGGAFAEILSKELIPTTTRTGGGVSNIININDGKGDLGLTGAILARPAMNGEPPFNKKMTNVAAIANLYRQWFYFVIDKDFADKHGIKSVDDIFKKKIPIRLAVLKPGTLSEFTVRALLKTGYGVTYDDIKKWGGEVVYASYTDGANQLINGRIDAFAFTLSNPSTVIMKIEARKQIYILPISDEVRKKMAEQYGTVTFVFKPGTYKCIKEDTPTIGTYTQLIVRKDLPEDLVYQITKIFFENKDELAKSIKALGELTPEEAAKNTVFPLHPGAKKYYEEIGALK
ncbi:TAXI family TRAP transporter solute-binding subunit [Thermococcus barophilus]|uniref:TRAP transporter solute receptor, TAXI family n=1 Tax=Thermococcus barophilus TaxID=55802 RepID=A0A0S1XF33_THEBA|nr:TAXI family TRAP transporter solute-binding subunit [Thermococcus barophilus]ALM76441.1 TRAP transporter solute receptor, TAXI family [Thermococcus barophilus]